jgi:sirohydrochlorin cobaltochelatase
MASLSFLDHMEPKFLYACQEVIKSGASEIVVVPLFLGAGGHVRQDVPELVREAERETGVSITVTQAIGEQTEVLRAIAETSLNLIGAIHQ